MTENKQNLPKTFTRYRDKKKIHKSDYHILTKFSDIPYNKFLVGFFVLLAILSIGYSIISSFWLIGLLCFYPILWTVLLAIQGDWQKNQKKEKESNDWIFIVSLLTLTIVSIVLIGFILPIILGYFTYLMRNYLARRGYRLAILRGLIEKESDVTPKATA